MSEIQNQPVGISDRFERRGERRVARQMPHYNLDMIISLGYRVKSAIATRFRRWATERLEDGVLQ